MMLKRKINTLKKILITNKMTKPRILGDKILILATAPCVSKFFEEESVRKQFEGYDIACVNYMLYYSKEDVFKIKPKYFILMDPCLYQEHVADKNDASIPHFTEMAEIINQIDWECYIVTNVLAEFQVNNPLVKFIRISCFSSEYKSWKIKLFEKNLIHMGCYNVIQGAIYFAITFGYKHVAMLGCPYRTLERVMTSDGLEVHEHMHYYDKEQFIYTIPYEELRREKESMSMKLCKRGFLSAKCLWNLAQYADTKKCEIINYSEGSMIEAFRAEKLNVN